MISNKKSICAVVVTYNRKNLLLSCLEALEKQIYPLSHIVVVNNASTDGTMELLHQNGWVNNSKFTLINLDYNQGGAGGFYEGIKFAYQNNFDYIWLMDDDGYPEENCLFELMSYIKEDNYIGPLVLNKENTRELTFTLRLPKSNKVLSNYDDIDKTDDKDIIHDVVMPFNGILFSKKLVEDLGYPLKQYFIWGDDMEYTWRARRKGFKIFTVKKARFLHPKEITLGTPMFFNLLKFNDTDSKLKLYCMCRNNIRNLLDYKGKIISILFVVKLIWFYVFTNPNFLKLKIGIRGIFDGVSKNFLNHKDYL